MGRHVEGPWFRAAKDTWYATVGGRKVSLGVRGKANRKAAQEAWHRLMADGPPAKAEPEPAARTVAEVIDAYLRHQEAKVKAETLRWLKRWLFPFKETHGVR